MNIRITKTWWIIAVLTFMAIQAEATNYYVDADGGDDYNPGTKEEPWQTISKVESSASSGDSVYFQRNDIWADQLDVPASNMSFEAYGSGDKPLIKGEDIRAYGILSSGKDSIVIRNIAVTGATQHGINIHGGDNITIKNTRVSLFIDCGINIYSDLAGGNVKHLDISNNIVTGGLKSIRLLAAPNSSITDIKISGNELSQFGTFGIHIVNGTSMGVIAHNIIRNGGGIDWGRGIELWGLDAFNYPDNIAVEFNDISRIVNSRNDNTEGVGIGIDSNSHNITVRYNYSHENQGNGVAIHEATNTDVISNVFFNNGTDVFDLNLFDVGCMRLSKGNSILRVYNNTCVAGNGGVYVNDESSGVLLVNNIISDTTNFGIHYKTENNATEDYNCVHNNSSNFINVMKSANTIESDPLLTNPIGGDFSLSEASPCISGAKRLDRPYALALLPDSSWPNAISTNYQDYYEEWEMGAYIYLGPDTDSDDIPDAYEKTFSLNSTLSSDALADVDADGLTNREEYEARTRPDLADTDEDGINDAAELFLGLDPNRFDSDEDGFSDLYEIGDGIEPTDTDGDGKINALDTDSDNDGVLDEEESEWDQDGNGIPDRLDNSIATGVTEAGQFSLMIRGEDGSLEDVYFLEQPIEQQLLPYQRFPFGGACFKVSGLSHGASATMHIEVSYDIPSDARIWKYDTREGYYTYSAIFDENSIEYILTDGGPGDSDRTVNGTIVDPVFIGVPLSTNASNVPTSENTGGDRWGCSLSQNSNGFYTGLPDLAMLFVPGIVLIIVRLYMRCRKA